MPQSAILGLAKPWLVYRRPSTSLLVLDGVKVIGSPNIRYFVDILNQTFQGTSQLRSNPFEGQKKHTQNGKIKKRIVNSINRIRPMFRKG